ncbi:HNH endonuclease [Pseudomonas aeruginosa]|uniref:HNH endonuclease n=1 Tax=Pseudomonas aeruginosa TaxID=287 RepID=UPI0013870B27|nr:HNH endonuclease [Pseudomonas aeruginosa]MBH9240114.1 HNH endonuclease [Pseudomonas aeruginosa]WCW10109.1 HNH endonuclease [Pseudomonas aeruginosa]HBO5115384.1 HNH endonuclease [Pseudomonas aeruginosa]HCF3016305.1 HNH endonuclease [Pseudomonas aeruginosa]HCI1750187.1 HNH endonuclease [Pseudomonas aeruginosa]
MLRLRKPIRREVEERSPYTKYRDELREDFNQACGYCDDDDRRADKTCFHIDHFAPRKYFPHLENTYTNLVYSCRFCNVRKSDHWIGNDPLIHNDGKKGFVDPCDDEYDEHLGRALSGRIFGKTELGCYMVRRLNLNLLRHELLWNSRKVRLLRDQVRLLLDNYLEAGLPKDYVYIELLERFLGLTEKIEAYEVSASNG